MKQRFNDKIRIKDKIKRKIHKKDKVLERSVLYYFERSRKYLQN